MIIIFQKIIMQSGNRKALACRANFGHFTHTHINFPTTKAKVSYVAMSLVAMALVAMAMVAMAMVNGYGIGGTYKIALTTM